MAAFSGFYESHRPTSSVDARGLVLAHHHGHCNGQHTERVVARWRHFVAFMTALDLLHGAMRAVLHHCTAMAMDTASDGGTCVRCPRLFCLIKCS